jgi:hypothetical protein
MKASRMSVTLRRQGPGAERRADFENYLREVSGPSKDGSASAFIRLPVARRNRRDVLPPHPQPII